MAFAGRLHGCGSEPPTDVLEVHPAEDDSGKGAIPPREVPASGLFARSVRLRQQEQDEWQAEHACIVPRPPDSVQAARAVGVAFIISSVFRIPSSYEVFFTGPSSFWIAESSSTTGVLWR